MVGFITPSSMTIHSPSPKLPSLSPAAISASLDIPDMKSSSDSILVLAAVRGVAGNLGTPSRLVGLASSDGASVVRLAFLL